MMSSVKLICVLDGGGMRGFYEMDVLRTIIQHNRNGQLKFDLAVGVSAGGIVAAFLALGKFNDEKFDVATFYSLTREIFKVRNKNGPLFRPKYDGTPKKQILRKFFGDARLGDVSTHLAIVCATLDGGIVNLCSWKKEHKSLLLADVLDATTAAPFYFPPVKLMDIWLTDGGIRANKPLIQAFLFSRELFSKNSDFRFLSIGTFFRSKYRFEGDRQASFMGVWGWLKQGILQVFMGTQDETQEELFELLFGDNFLRLVCTCDDIVLDDQTPTVPEILQESALHSFLNNKQKLKRLLNLEFD